MSNELPVSIGNDVIDLVEDVIPLHKRYKNRVFTSYELNAIADSSKLLWLYWSAKESAYKAFKRLKPYASFIPIQFEFDLKTNQVIKDDEVFATCRSTITDEYIYTICITDPVKVSFDRTKNWVACSSFKSARELAREKISNECLLEIEELEICSDSNAIPKLYYKGQESNRLISLTDHGRYVACMCLKENSLQKYQ